MGHALSGCVTVQPVEQLRSCRMPSARIGVSLSSRSIRTVVLEPPREGDAVQRAADRDNMIAVASVGNGQPLPLLRSSSSYPSTSMSSARSCKTVLSVTAAPMTNLFGVAGSDAFGHCPLHDHDDDDIESGDVIGKRCVPPSIVDAIRVAAHASSTHSATDISRSYVASTMSMWATSHVATVESSCDPPLFPTFLDTHDGHTHEFGSLSLPSEVTAA